jgi:Fe-S cluster assembly iron-binding protein IscA
MLSISQSAAEVIKQVVSASEISEEGGIRLSVEPLGEQSAKLDVSIAESPEAGDSVVEEDGANVFIEPGAATFLDDKVLDATIEGDRVSFSLSERRPDWSHNGQPKGFDPGTIG